MLMIGRNSIVNHFIINNETKRIIERSFRQIVANYSMYYKFKLQGKAKT